MKLLILFAVAVAAFASKDEERLLQDIFGKRSEYAPMVRPIANESHALNVSFGLIIMRLHPFPQGKNILDSSVWPKLGWQDAGMSWKPEEYGGVTAIRVPSEKIFIPDIAVYNSVDMSLLKSGPNHDAVIYCDGNIAWIPQSNHKTACEYKRDENGEVKTKQSCYIKYGSWAMSGNLMHLTLDEGQPDISEYVPDSCWKLTDSSAQFEVKHYDCCPEPYEDVKITLQFEKQDFCHIMPNSSLV